MLKTDNPARVTGDPGARVNLRGWENPDAHIIGQLFPGTIVTVIAAPVDGMALVQIVGVVAVEYLSEIKQS